MAKILHKLGAFGIMTSGQKVCSLWWNICKDPLMWRTTDMRIVHTLDLDSNFRHLESICRHAINRSCGQLVDIDIEVFGTDSLLKYIADRSRHLRCMRLACCLDITNQGMINAVKNLTLLEELNLSFCILSEDSLEAIGRCCPLLKSLKFVSICRVSDIDCDNQAFAIARSMPQLRILQLFFNCLTDSGLLAILDACPRLESLDLRGCFNVQLEGNLGQRCASRFKNILLPPDHPAKILEDYVEELIKIINTFCFSSLLAPLRLP